ncbi:GntR family transcriptional regulator [Vibrio alginolyticus]|uniref:GntR family transcriptional regulator n=1 Tax=Vibrio harveyi group TaxID=717610 RepID=UPI00226B4AD5|nr:GntR family transcriptional regulator [Vibrio parahaemolyticus]EJC7036913.1 GntR family transcriptional regulator [Vibrio parahaemolyticus]MCX8850273.1 GntR family transcriptional regulator [Vibrio parahaemolyticus]
MNVKINLTNKTEVAYNQLEKMIIFRELEPGSMVSEKQLAENLNLGRTPVREALQRLSYERMVEIHPRRGVQIPAISVESQLKILEVRRDIEALCVKYAAVRASVDEKQQMQELAVELELCAETGDEITYASLLKNIHCLLVKAARNEYLQLAMAPLQGLSRRFWFVYKNNTSDLAEASSLHASVLRAVCHTDQEEAIAASHKLNDYLTDVAYRSIGSR